MWSFWVEANMCRFVYSFVIYLLSLEIPLSWGEGWDPINRFNTATLLCRSKTRTLTSKVICCGLFSIQTRIYIVERIRISYCLVLSRVARFYATTEQKLIHSFWNALRIRRKINQLHESSCYTSSIYYTKQSLNLPI